MSIRDYGIAAPHGPNMNTDQHVATNDVHDMSAKETEVFNYLLLPDDSYNAEGKYWADMKMAERVKFVGKVDSEESRAELRSIGRMMKEDPLSPVGYYFRNMIVPGAGLLLEG